MQSVPLQLISFWQERVAQIVQAGQDEMIVQPLEYFENLEDTGVYSRVVYMKAALFFYELRQEIGDEAFFAALRNYYQEQQFQIAYAQDLFDAFETASGRSLETFYSQKLYTAQP
jgi:aminopeptidase N